jgi:hypothetical protein
MHLERPHTLFLGEGDALLEAGVDLVVVAIHIIFRQWIDEHAATFGLRADQVSHMLEHVSLDEVQERLHEKDGVRRFLLGLHATADLLANGPVSCAEAERSGKQPS